MDIVSILGQEFSIKHGQAENIVTLIDEGSTIPFIARYRKEATGSLDDQVLRDIADRLAYLRNLNDKREQARKTITEQGNMTDEINAALGNAKTLAEIEDIYRPFKPKRRTRATIAREKGLQDLAMLIYLQETTESLDITAAKFIDEEKGVMDIHEALQGAYDIVAEIISDDANIRGLVRHYALKEGIVATHAVKGAEGSVYEMYYDYTEPVKKIAGHRVLAINRGEAEKFLSVAILQPEEIIIGALNKRLVKNNEITRALMINIIEDSYKRLIAPSIEREIRGMLTQDAEEGAIKVFGENLKPLLMQPPVKDKTILAIDPGYRTGCKIAVLDQTGKALHTGVIYPTAPQNKTEESKKALLALIEKYSVNIITIGNGTASRETEKFIAEMIKENKLKLQYAIVNEAGASIYSASKLGAKEFPDLDVSLRSAISIGRRLQDPLAELVKIEPKSIGVGQYQHDMNQKRLEDVLRGVVEACVNNVGANLNTASAALLSYVSGITPTIAKNIMEYRDKNGKFTERGQLKDVKGLGPKAFEQCAGFLRILDGEHALDQTGVHPESYTAALGLIKLLGYDSENLSGKGIKGIKEKAADLAGLAKQLGIGVPTLSDIIGELEKPGQDPRDDMPPPIFSSDVLDMADLSEGMILKGTVRNAIDFGVFVDIGVGQDGLVHISQIADRYIKHPLEAVKIGDAVTVKVLSVDINKKRISLSMKGV